MSASTHMLPRTFGVHDRPEGVLSVSTGHTLSILAYLGFHFTLGHWDSAFHRKFCIALERGGSNMARTFVLQQEFSVTSAGLETVKSYHNTYQS
jgi:hypothetical protein